MSEYALPATAWQTPAAMSGFSSLLAMSEMTSDSAKTEHMLAISRCFLLSSAAGPSSSRLISSERAIISRKRPVPAAHLSFIAKSVTSPVAFTWMALLSWPPMSRMVRTAGLK